MLNSSLLDFHMVHGTELKVVKDLYYYIITSNAGISTHKQCHLVRTALVASTEKTM